MLAHERQNKIYDMIQRDRAVTTAMLVRIFGVSIETIRRDLLTLEQSGKLMRVHGGAVAKTGMKPYMELKQRHKEFKAQKYAVSLKAAEFIEDRDIIGVDCGSTAIYFAEVLKEKFSQLTVVTHSKDVFNILCDHKDFTVILCGGHYLRGENAFCGELTLSMLRNLHIQKSFIFPSAVSLEYGICDYQKDLYQVQKQMMLSSDKVHILADSSKFEKTGLLKLDSMKTEYVYVTDSSLQGDVVNLYKENNIEIHLGRHNHACSFNIG
jgi:DeoR/GlpR family transcriptional regulator of sugar metabolism